MIVAVIVIVIGNVAVAVHVNVIGNVIVIVAVDDQGSINFVSIDTIRSKSSIPRV